MSYLDNYLAKAEKSQSDHVLKQWDRTLVYATGCIILAWKFTQVLTPSFEDMARLVWGEEASLRKKYSAWNLKTELKNVELYLLKTLHWQLCPVVSPYTALLHIKKALDFEENTHWTKLDKGQHEQITRRAYNNILQSLVTEDCRKFAPVTIAASSLIAACCIGGHDELWNDCFKPLARDICSDGTDIKGHAQELEHCTGIFLGGRVDSSRYTEDAMSTFFNSIPPPPPSIATAWRMGRVTDRSPPHPSPWMEEDSELEEPEEMRNTKPRRDLNAEIELEAKESLNLDTSDEDELELEADESLDLDTSDDDEDEEIMESPAQSPAF